MSNNKYNLNPNNISKILAMMECNSLIDKNIKRKNLPTSQRYYTSNNFSKYVSERWEDIKWEIENDCYRFFDEN